MPDWNEIFVPSTPVLEIVIRGSLVFLAVTAMMRITGQREAGELSLTDLLVVVLVASAVADGMSGGYSSVPEAVILAATILGWSVALDAAAYRFPAFARVVKADRRTLIRDGVLNRRVMHREFITREEVENQLRLQGVASVDDVAAAYLEPNGMISVFRRDGEDTKPTPEPPE